SSLRINRNPRSRYPKRTRWLRCLPILLLPLRRKAMPPLQNQRRQLRQQQPNAPVNVDALHRVKSHRNPPNESRKRLLKLKRRMKKRPMAVMEETMRQRTMRKIMPNRTTTKPNPHLLKNKKPKRVTPKQPIPRQQLHLPPKKEVVRERTASMLMEQSQQHRPRQTEKPQLMERPPHKRKRVVRPLPNPLVNAEPKSPSNRHYRNNSTSVKPNRLVKMNRLRLYRWISEVRY